MEFDNTLDVPLPPADAGGKVLIHTNVKLSGAVAQYGRGSGTIQSFSAPLINQFGERLKARLAQTQSPASPGADEPAALPSPVKLVAGPSRMRSVRTIAEWS